MRRIIAKLFLASSVATALSPIPGDHYACGVETASIEQPSGTPAASQNKPETAPSQGVPSPGPRGGDPKTSSVESKAQNPTTKLPPGPPQLAPLSIPEQVAQLRRTIQAEEVQLSDLTKESKDPESEYQPNRWRNLTGSTSCWKRARRRKRPWSNRGSRRKPRPSRPSSST